MQKKLLAVAVAGVLAAPAVAFAQSSVTISGKIIASFGQMKISNRAAGSVGNSSETEVRDESSRVIFQVREDLGGGLAAIGKFDVRWTTDIGGGSSTGETYVGLTSPSWGTITTGKHDFHYANHASFSGVHGGLLTNPTLVFDVAGAGGAVIANQTRTSNSIRYGSPKFGDMFEIVVGYSSNATASGSNPTLTGTAGAAGVSGASFNGQQENDLRSPVRKGSAWNINPKIWGANWEAGYSYWMNKPDLGLAAAAAATGTVAVPAAIVKHRGDSLYGWYKWGGLRVGLAWNKSKVETTALAGATLAAMTTGATTTTSNRTAWGIPIAYSWGAHTVYFDYFKARNDKAAAFAGLDTHANFLNLNYAYDLSKRTAVVLAYTKITNGTSAAYNLFGNQSHQGVVAGEDPSFLGVTLNHRF